jgi:hypothetical protein
MNSDKDRKNKGVSPSRNQKGIIDSSNWIQRGLDLAEALEKSKATAETDRQATRNQPSPTLIQQQVQQQSGNSASKESKFQQQDQLSDNSILTKISPGEVSLGAIVRENLPFPIVYYPNHYGTFFGFAQSESSVVVLCACAEPAIRNLLTLKSILPKYPRGVIGFSDPLREVLYDNYFFPNVIAELSLKDPLYSVPFVPKLCPRCNLSTPSLRYCHEMYGGKFIQWHGWYVNQAYPKLGIYPDLSGGFDFEFEFLPDECPSEYHEDIIAVKKGLKKRRELTRKIENIVRQEFGFKKVGEGWVSENILYKIVCQIFANRAIMRHHRPAWLLGLELDIYLPELNLAFEYQGQQHFHPIEAWGGEEALKKVQERDKRKAEICKKVGVKLITVSYTEPLTEDYIRRLLVEQSLL